MIVYRYIFDAKYKALMANYCMVWQNDQRDTMRQYVLGGTRNRFYWNEERMCFSNGGVFKANRRRHFNRVDDGVHRPHSRIRRFTSSTPISGVRLSKNW